MHLRKEDSEQLRRLQRHVEGSPAGATLFISHRAVEVARGCCVFASKSKVYSLLQREASCASGISPWFFCPQKVIKYVPLLIRNKCHSVHMMEVSDFHGSDPSQQELMNLSWLAYI